MNKYGHTVIATGLTVYAIYNGYYILVPGIIAGSFLPDIDVRSSKRLINRVYNNLPRCKLFGREGWNHRSLLLHSVWTVITLFGLTLYLESGLLLGLAIGVLFHHIADYNPSYLKKYLRGST